MKNSNILLIIIGVFAAIFFIAGGSLLYIGLSDSDEETAVATATDVPGAAETVIAEQVAQAIAATSTANAILNPQPIATVDTSVSGSSTNSDGPPPSPTSPATVEPTATPDATDTPVPTNTPPPTNTPVPLPTSPPPTATPIPQPTNTSPPPGPVPGQNTRGLIADLQFQAGRSSQSPNGKLWFGWTVRNTTGGDVPYNAIGILARRDGVDYPQWFDFHYGGDDSVIKPEGRTWEAWADVPESGNFTFRLVVCFDGRNTCEAGNGTYHTLSPEIAVPIN